MFLRLLAKLFRCSSAPAARSPSIRPPLNASLIADIPDSSPDQDDSCPPSAVEREKRNLLETITTAIPQLEGDAGGDHRLPDGSIRVPLPQGLDVENLKWKFKHSHAFRLDQAGETVIKDEFHAHNFHYKPTLSSAWKTKAQVLQARVAKSHAMTMKKALAWLESLVSSADPKLLPRIRPIMDLESIWEQLAFIVNVALAEHDASLVDNVSTPASEKVDPAPDNTVFFVLGLLKDPEDSCLNIYSVQLTGWAEYDAHLGLLRSGMKGVLRCVQYEEPPSKNA